MLVALRQHLHPNVMIQALQLSHHHQYQLSFLFVTLFYWQIPHETAMDPGGTHRQHRRCQSQSSIRIRNRPHSACRYRDTKRKRKDYSLKSNQSAANLLSSARKLDLKNINDVGSLSTRNVVLHKQKRITGKIQSNGI